MSWCSEQSKLVGQLSSWLRCCNDFTNTKQFPGSKDTVFDCFACPLQGVGQRLARPFPSVPFALPCSAPSCGASLSPWDQGHPHRVPTRQRSRSPGGL